MSPARQWGLVSRPAGNRNFSRATKERTGTFFQSQFRLSSGELFYPGSGSFGYDKAWPSSDSLGRADAKGQTLENDLSALCVLDQKGDGLPSEERTQPL